MKTKHLIRKGGLYATLSSFVLFSCTMNPAVAVAGKEEALAVQVIAAPLDMAGAGIAQPRKKIRIALLLDTSNSMDGLINQAKSQLWKIVNELSLAHYNHEKPELEIALYEYGNDRLSARTGFIRQVCPFTQDLDLLSEKLFALTTMGGSEYCGQVIQSATQELQWTDAADLQTIFIAGNEEFTQGSVKYGSACAKAKEKSIFVNTIFCGSCEEGVNTMWKDGADITGGSYMCIEQGRKTIYIESPYDKDILSMNEKLNATYVSYGSLASYGSGNQMAQDKNAESFGKENLTTRIVTKSKSVYKNSSWDLVDRSEEKDFDITKIKDSELPKELRGKSKEEKERYIAQKKAERAAVIKQVAELNKKREAYIAEKSKAEALQDEKSLDFAMLKAIRAQAQQKGFSFED